MTNSVTSEVAIARISALLQETIALLDTDYDGIDYLRGEISAYRKALCALGIDPETLVKTY